MTVLNNGKPWSRQEKEMLIAAMRNGVESHELFSVLPGRSYPGICRMREKLRKEGAFDASRRNVTRYWQDWEIRRLMELYDEGLDVAEIAKRLERTERAIEAKASELGCKRDHKLKRLREVEPIFDDANHFTVAELNKANRAHLADLVREYCPRDYGGWFPIKAARKAYRARCELSVPREGAPKVYAPEPISTYRSSAAY